MSAKRRNAGLAGIQQAFVHRYMDRDGVIGVRVRRLDGQIVLVVGVTDPAAAELPQEFRGLPVRVRAGRRGILAYSLLSGR